MVDDPGTAGLSRWTTNALKRTVPTNRLAFQPARVAHRRTSVSAPSASVETAGEAEAGSNDATVVARTGGGGVGFLVAAGNAQVSAGVAGRVTLSGTPAPELPVELGPMCGPLRSERPTTRHYVVGADGGLADVLVFVHRGPEDAGSIDRDRELLARPLVSSAPALQGSVRLDQVGCMFEPYVTAMQMTQVLEARNSDPVLHNLHFTPRRNRERNIGQPRQGQVNEFRFEVPETFVRLKCDVHPWMFAYVSVLPHPFFAVTDSDGLYRIPGGLAPGSYFVSALHLKAGGLTKRVKIDFGKERIVDFRFSPSPARQNSVARNGGR